METNSTQTTHCIPLAFGGSFRLVPLFPVHVFLDEAEAHGSGGCLVASGHFAFNADDNLTRKKPAAAVGESEKMKLILGLVTIMTCCISTPPRKKYNARTLGTKACVEGQVPSVKPLTGQALIFFYLPSSA